jgi:hypothetical protein
VGQWDSLFSWAKAGLGKRVSAIASALNSSAQRGSASGAQINQSWKAVTQPSFRTRVVRAVQHKSDTAEAGISLGRLDLQRTPSKPSSISSQPSNRPSVHTVCFSDMALTVMHECTDSTNEHSSSGHRRARSWSSTSAESLPHLPARCDKVQAQSGTLEQRDSRVSIIGSRWV